MKRIIVACGSGVATSETVAIKIRRLLAERGIDAEVEAVDVKSVHLYLKRADAYVQNVPSGEKYDIPTVSGIPFLTGIKMKEEFDKLLAYLTE